jgi:hypothetical protein
MVKTGAENPTGCADSRVENVYAADACASFVTRALDSDSEAKPADLGNVARRKKPADTWWGQRCGTMMKAPTVATDRLGFANKPVADAALNRRVRLVQCTALGFLLTATTPEPRR